MLLLQLAVIAVLLVSVGFLSVRQSNADFSDEHGRRMRSIAEYVATLPEVRSALQEVRTGAGSGERPAARGWRRTPIAASPSPARPT